MDDKLIIYISKIVTNIVLLINVIFVIYFIYLVTWKNRKERYDNTISCPRRGEFLECENIEDEKLRILKCKSLQTHCQEQANKSDLPPSTIQDVL